jgi:hypothetical protein
MLRAYQKMICFRVTQRILSMKSNAMVVSCLTNTCSGFRKLRDVICKRIVRPASGRRRRLVASILDATKTKYLINAAALRLMYVRRRKHTCKTHAGYQTAAAQMERCLEVAQLKRCKKLIVKLYLKDDKAKRGCCLPVNSTEPLKNVATVPRTLTFHV